MTSQMRIILGCITLAIVLGCCLMAQAATFYLDGTGGNDGNDGTAGNPKLTMGGAEGVASSADTINIVNMTAAITAEKWDTDGGYIYDSNSVYQHNIIWDFNGFYRIGRFTNYDFWVLADGADEVKVIDISQTNAEAGHDGSMINPTPVNENINGYDDRVPGYNASYNVTSDLPNLILDVNDSLVSSISVDPDASLAVGAPRLDYASVLTVVGLVSDPNCFRPPYMGASKPLYTSTGLDVSWLLSVDEADTGIKPSYSDLVDEIEHLWLDHRHTDFSASHIQPECNMESYGAGRNRDPGDCLLRMMADELTTDQKTELLMYMTQIGIDYYQATTLDFMEWGHRNGGIGRGKKIFIMVAGKALGNDTMLEIKANTPTYTFQTDNQFVYLVSDAKTGNPSYWDGVPVGYPVWMENYYRFLYNGTVNPGNTNYRPIARNSSIGTGLAILMMGVETELDNDAYLDFLDREYKENGGFTLGSWGTQFSIDMWDLYRDDYPPVWSPTSIKYLIGLK